MTALGYKVKKIELYLDTNTESYMVQKKTHSPFLKILNGLN
jgi:hypothetical protein